MGAVADRRGERRQIGELRLCLAARRSELVEATLARVYGVADPAEVGDPGYVAGLRSAVSAAVLYGIAGLDGRAERLSPVPSELAAQARVAARHGVPLETVLRRYFAGYVLLGEFVAEVAEDGGLALGVGEMRRLWHAEAVLFDRLVAVIAAEHAAESRLLAGSPERDRAERVRRMLDGEPLDPAELRYDLNGWHLGVVASGPGARSALRHLAAALGRRHLAVVAQDGRAVWAWLGGGEGLGGEAVREAAARVAGDIALAFGEPAPGPEGWRLTHRQAKAAHAIALRSVAGPVRYVDVALLATAIRDEVLAASLRETYLRPLELESDGGEILRRTLRVYFSRGRNGASAAAELGVSRQTVLGRLRKVELRLGRTIDECAPELETALRLAELAGPLTIAQPA
jgi:hypothetical protein